MTSLFRSIMNNKNQSNGVKQAIIAQLSMSIKEIQLEYSESDSALITSNATDELCTVLEAIFVHGMKETFFNKMSFALSSDLDSLPQPNFWPSLLVYSHREVIDQINKLTQVKSDIGRCRAWVRIALNDTLTSSYLATMKKDSKTLRHYYKTSAFVRDSECLNIAITMIEGIEACRFELAYNSSLLNAWTDSPLVLAGLWTPAMKPTPVGVATDVAETITTMEDKFDDSVSSMMSISSFQTTGSLITIPVNEEEALRIILSTPTHNSPFEPTRNRMESESDEKSENTDSNIGSKNLEFSSNSSNLEVISASKNDKTSSESSINQDPVSDNQNDFTPLNVNKNDTNESFSSLLSKYNKSNLLNETKHDIHAIKPEDVLRLCLESKNKELAVKIISDEVNESSNEDFEVVGETARNPSGESSGFIEYLYRIPTDQGLDAQNYICKNCSQHVGIHFARAVYCKYSGCYFCSDCHLEDTAVIPARVVFNWDFQYYPVCNKAINFLADIQLHPLFNLKTLNPKLISAVPDLDRAQKMRLQLYYLAKFLTTCRESVADQLKKLIWPREYLYEHMNIYSIADLSQISNGTLIPFLQQIVTFASDHVLNCSFCSLKGFICEICEDPKVIYPFQLETTYQCPRCNGVYHSNCFKSAESCPKCKRKEKYQKAKSVHSF